MVAQAGVEPAHPYEYTILNRARLPIPPLSHVIGLGFMKLPETENFGNSISQG